MVHHCLMNTPDAQFKLRLPAPLKERLDQSAERSGRSLSAEIVHRLEGSYQQTATADGLLKSNLLNFQLAAELLKHNPRMVTAVSHLMSKLFEDETVRDRVLELADEGDQIAVMARDTAIHKLPGILEDVKAKMAAITEKGDELG